MPRAGLAAPGIWVRVGPPLSARGESAASANVVVGVHLLSAPEQTTCVAGHCTLPSPVLAPVWQAIGAPQSCEVLPSKIVLRMVSVVPPAIAPPKKPEPPGAVLPAKVQLTIVPPF